MPGKSTIAIFSAIAALDSMHGLVMNLPLETAGPYGYVRSALRQFIRYRSKRYSLNVDGQHHEIRAFLIAIANSGQYGGNVYISLPPVLMMVC